uniref:Uncharacterized protein n=1 Tax=Globodera rostochiensis TaxID=31243 RepID=A0A914GTI9_GLORO
MSRNPHFYAVKGVDTPIWCHNPRRSDGLGFVVFQCFLVQLFCCCISHEPLFALEPPLWVVQRKRDLYERMTFVWRRNESNSRSSECVPSCHCDSDEHNALFASGPMRRVGGRMEAEPVDHRTNLFVLNSKVVLVKLSWRFGKVSMGTIGCEEEEVDNALRQYDKEGGRDNEVMSKEDENMKNLFIWLVPVCQPYDEGEQNGDEHFANVLLDILNTFRPIMYNVADDKPKEVDEADFSNRTINKKPKVELYWHRSEWTPCNKCGDRVGERRRTKSCYLKRNGMLPTTCRPLCCVLCVWQIALPQHVNTDELKSATEPKSDILRRIYQCKNRARRPSSDNDRYWLMMDCSNQDATALIWRKRFVEMNGTRIVSWEDGRERQRGCTAYPSGHILRTFRVFITLEIDLQKCWRPCPSWAKISMSKIVKFR